MPILKFAAKRQCNDKDINFDSLEKFIQQFRSEEGGWQREREGASRSFQKSFQKSLSKEGASMSFQKEKIFCFFAEFFSQWNFLIIS